MKKQGFTLLEIMIVIIIISILAVIGLPKYNAVVERARSQEGIKALTEILKAQQSYFLERRAYATALTDLDVVVNAAQKFGNVSLTDCTAADTCAATYTSTNGGYHLDLIVDLAENSQSIIRCTGTCTNIIDGISIVTP